jgi:hypothetical protein
METEMETNPIDQPEVPETDHALKDRRRPGRSDDVSPELISLLRTTARIDADGSEWVEGRDELSAARGMIAGVFLSVPLWLAIGLTLWIVL